MRILLIEDDIQKGNRLNEFLTSSIENCDLLWVKSVTGAIIALDDNLSPFDFLVLDMSLPTFEEGHSIFSGGRQQNYGGGEVLAYMAAMSITCPTIIVTQFPDFEDRGQLMTLAQLNDNLKRDFPDLYLGMVQYKNNEESWKSLVFDFMNGNK